MTDFEYDLSDDDSDSDYDYDITYDAEDVSHTRFNIVLCEIYNEKIHGKPSIGSNVQYHYFTINRYKKLDMKVIDDVTEYLNYEYRHIHRSNCNHNIFSNYSNIIVRENYIRPQIAECLYLVSGECIAIIKTFWIKIIQRAWKRVYKERQNMFMKRCSISALRYREMNGKWPQSCLIYPSLRGMLSV